MKSMILAAGLGTRLRPWTDTHPKALVPVKGVPMLERVILRLKSCGVDSFVVNVHHFASQIVDFLNSKDFGVEIKISYETTELLDTGGALVKAKDLLDFESGPVIVHNVDILSDADIEALVRGHMAGGEDASLLVSGRESSRKLIFDERMVLKGWHNCKENAFRPAGFRPCESYNEFAFSGICVVGGAMVTEMESMFGGRRFPIMDYYLSPNRRCVVKGFVQQSLNLIDIGKPETLLQAGMLEGLD